MGRTSRKRQQKKNLKFMEITESGEQILMHLKSWMLVNNCLSVHNLMPYNFSITGRGLKALRDIKAGDTLIKIPYQMLITTSTLSESCIKILFSKAECYSAQFILSVFLVYEAHLGKGSNWYCYISSLPQTFTNPDYCTQKEKLTLPAFVLEYMHRNHKLQNDFCLLMRSMKDLALHGVDRCSHCNVPFTEILTFNKYKWAYYVVNTRAVYVDMNSDKDINIKQPNNLALAPYLDLFNHDVHTAVCTSTATDMAMNKFYQIVTLKSFNKGSQVFINYGAHSSLKLYVEYGFFIPNNPLDEVYFDIHDIQACITVCKSKLDFVLSNKLERNMAFIKDGLNYNAKSTLFILSSNSQKEFWSKKIYGGSLSTEDLCNISNMGKMILNLKRGELINRLTNMKHFEHPSQSLSIAISLTEEYITILNESFNNLNVSCLI